MRAKILCFVKGSARIPVDKIDITEKFEKKALDKVDILYNWIKNNFYGI